MAIEHRNIPESGLHEPKGVSTAASDRVYISDGVGSGEWTKVDADALQGTISNTIPEGRRVITDGAGGFTASLVPADSFGTMNLTNNSTAQAVTAATDSSLNTDSDFEELSLAFDFDNVQNMVSGSNYLEVESSGLYLIDFWANVAVDTSSTRWSLKFVINDIDFVTRGPKLWMGTANEYYNVSANGIHAFTAGDQVKLYMAANKGVGVTIEDMTFQMVLVGEDGV